MRNFQYILYLIVQLITASCNDNTPAMVARVNNELVTKSELQYWMLLKKANVYNYFYRKYKVDDSDQFWTQKRGGEIPLETLKELALENVKRCKTQQILALEKGIINTTNFNEIIGEMDKVNAERKEKAEKGEPIYGPVQFTTRTYFFHVFDKMVIELKNELVKNELKPHKEELQLMQEKAGQTSRDNTGFLSMQYVDNHYDSYIDMLVSGVDIELNEEVYEKISLN